MKNEIFDKIYPNEALKILKQITKTDKYLKKKILKLAEDLYRDVDVDEISEAVFDALDGIDVHELWDRAGPKSESERQVFLVTAVLPVRAQQLAAPRM